MHTSSERQTPPVSCVNWRPSPILVSQSIAKGLLSPLPPIDVLRKLRRLTTDHKNNKESIHQPAQLYWSLLRRSVLMPLAGVIGADGRGGSGGMSGRYSSEQVGVES